MKPVKAIILAAGNGSRLSPLTDNTPKCLLDISGTTILEYQLVMLAGCGIKEVVLVGGFCVEKLTKFAKRYVAIHGLDLKLKVVNNREYKRTNNLYSLWLAKDEMTSDFLVLNGDNVFARETLIRVLEEQDYDVSLAIHRHEKYDNEDMKVRIVGDRVVDISKQVDNDIADGESIGLRIFRNGGVAAFRQALDRAVIEDRQRNQYFVKAIAHLIETGCNVGYVDVSSYLYLELDFHEDLSHIRIAASDMMIQSNLLYSNLTRTFIHEFYPYSAARLNQAV